MIRAILLCLLLTSCATVQTVAESPTTFAACKVADIATTSYALYTGRFVERNPFVSSIIGGGYIPLIAVSIALWYLIDYYDEPLLTIGANAITCPVAIHNAVLLM